MSLAPLLSLPLRLEGRARRVVAGRIEEIFGTGGQAQRPVQRSAEALFAPSSAIWRVHGDVTAMTVGGICALLLQMLHPAALAAVWDHSDFRRDMMGRLRRTARFMSLATYGARPDALAAIARVRSVHSGIHGVMPDGRAYRADDPKLLAWVHATAGLSFLRAWNLYGARPFSRREQDLYLAEFALIGEALGAAPVPRSRIEAERFIADMRLELGVCARTREVARLVLGQRAGGLAARPLQAVAFQAAVDLLPDWARRLHDLPSSGPARPLVTGGTMGMAQVVRWARLLD